MEDRFGYGAIVRVPPGRGAVAIRRRMPPIGNKKARLRT